MYMAKSPIFPKIVFNSFLSVFDILIDTVCREAEMRLFGEVEYDHNLICFVRSGGYTYI